MKKIALILLTLMFLLTGIIGCGDNEPEPEPLPTDPTPTALHAPTTMKITFTNDTRYNFQAIHISPVAVNTWGSDLLGNTAILKSDGGYIDLDVAIDGANSFDIKVIDEDRDEYIFERVPLLDGYTITISWNGGLMANIADQTGAHLINVPGTMRGMEGASDPGDQLDDFVPSYGFFIYNDSPYDITAILVGPSGGAADDDVNIITEILRGNDHIWIDGTGGLDAYEITEWTMFVIDIDNDKSIIYDVFNLWELKAVHINWDSSNNGYVKEFIYY